MNKKIMDSKKEAVSLVLRYKCEVFIIRRRETMRAFPGYWAFPGGKVDQGDVNIDAALRRELQEELGIQLESTDYQLQKIGTIEPPSFNPVSWKTHFIELNFKEKPAIELCSREFEWGEWMSAKAFVQAYEKGQALCVPPVLEICRQIAIGRKPSVDQSLVKTLRHRVPCIESLKGVIQLMPLSHTVPPADRTNCFVIGDEHPLIIDPAPRDDEQWEMLLQSLEEYQPSAVFLTHHHADHRSRVIDCSAHFDVPIMMSAFTRDILKRKLGENFFLGRPIELIQQGDIVGQWLGQDIIVWAVPGHDCGQLALAPRDFSWFIASDLFQGIGTVVIGPDEGDMALYFETLEKVIGLNPKVIYPSHGIALGGVEVLKRTLKHRHWRENQIEKLHKKGHGLEQMLKLIYFDLPKALIPYARANIQSHIDKLQKEGRLN